MGFNVTNNLSAASIAFGMRTARTRLSGVPDLPRLGCSASWHGTRVASWRSNGGDSAMS